jgi:hypothetical protein
LAKASEFGLLLSASLLLFFSCVSFWGNNCQIEFQLKNWSFWLGRKFFVPFFSRSKATKICFVVKNGLSVTFEKVGISTTMQC